MFGNPLRTGGNQFVAFVRGDTNIDPSEKLMEVVDQGCVLALCLRVLFFGPKDTLLLPTISLPKYWELRCYLSGKPAINL